jgi:hypothetical protein
MCPIAKTYVAFAFTGGCIATVLFFCRQLWSRAAVIAGVLFALGAALIFVYGSTIGSFALSSDKTAHLLLAIQLSVWGTIGISLIVLAVLDLNHHRDSDSVFLFFWIMGTFVFAGFVNWTTNGRSILPMAIPAGIMITRRLELRARPARSSMLPPTIAPLAVSMVLSFAVAWADTAFAETPRIAAMRIHDAFGNRRTVWFQGHWGFQYYMEAMGAKPVDVKAFRPAVGDVVAVPATNTNLFALPAGWPQKQTFEIPSTQWISSMNYQLGAGFYTDDFGPLPFAIGRVMSERFVIFEVAK